GCLGRQVEDEHTRSAGLGPLWVRITLADDELVVGVVIQVGCPYGMTPLDGLGDDLSAHRLAQVAEWAGGINYYLRPMPGLDRGDVAEATLVRAQPSVLDLARSLVRPRFLIARPELCLSPVPVAITAG